ncbi:MAG: hypothetical protein AB8H12_21315 [Lewinella sp.]
MKKLSFFLTLLLVPLTCTCVLAQNIGVDLERIVRLTPDAREKGTSDNNPALDTIVMTLAYYGGMPDVERIKNLLSGPELLAHYAANGPIRTYLLNEKLDRLLEGYTPGKGLKIPSGLNVADRGAFLQKLPGAELFSRNGMIDLGKIHEVFSAPPANNLSLKAAANSANDQPKGLSTANLVGSALAGLSDWISRRAQEELTYTFLTKLREDIQRNDLNYLFPKTNEFLPSLDLLNYKAILPSIRKAFVEDLNAIAFNFGNYLDARNQATFRDPVVYNVFLIYRILDLEMRDVPLANILAFTYGELERTRIDTRCAIDLQMTKVDTTNPGYQAILSTFDAVTEANATLNNRFLAARDTLSARLFNPLLTEIEEDDFASPNFEAFFHRIDSIYTPVDNASLALKNDYWETNSNPPATGIVQAWLRGKEAYEFYEAYPSLARFDQLFGPDADKLGPNQLRAAGLTAVREALAHRNELNTYEDQLRSLREAQEGLQNIRTEIRSQRDEAALKAKSLGENKALLLADIKAEAAVSDAPALRMLARLTDEVLPETKAGKQRLASIRQRLTEWVKMEGNANSPLAAKMREAPHQVDYFIPLQPAIDNARLAYNDLAAAVETYSANQADSLVRAYHNLSTFETVFGMAQQVFFLLSVDADSKDKLFVTNKDLALFQTNANAQQLLTGIGMERLNRVPDLGEFSTRGVTGFLLDFGRYLSDFQAASYGRGMDGLSPKQRKRIAAVSFITQTMESLLQAPVFNTNGQAGKPASLIEKFPAFTEVPAVSKELNELFRLSQTGEYRYAVDNLLNLLRLFDVAPTASKKQQRLEDRRDKLQQLIEDYVVNQNEDLKAIGLAPPSAAALPLFGNDDRDKILLSRYEAELNTPGLDVYAKQDATNSIRDLKVRRIQEELQIVQKKLRKLNPQRVDRFQEKLFKYGTFMADVAAANDPADFEAALTTIALPVGSSQIKRNRPSSLELGAYFGVALSRERLVLPPGTNAEGIEEDAFGAALFVPVGFSYSRNIGGRKSITFFGSIIDLGAITAFRLGSQPDGPGAPNVERLPEFRPANVIAPGFHVMYNFPKSPFTLGLGIQDGPSVREFTVAGSNIVQEARSVRGMLTFSIDVPVFRFFNK